MLHAPPRLPKKHHVFYTIFSLTDVLGRRKRGGCLRAARASPAPDNGNHPARPYPDLSGADASLMHFHWAPWLYSANFPSGSEIRRRPAEAGGQDETPSRRQGAELPAAGLCVEPGCERGGDGCHAAAASSPVTPARSCGTAPAQPTFALKAPKSAAR